MTLRVFCAATNFAKVGNADWVTFEGLQVCLKHAGLQELALGAGCGSWLCEVPGGGAGTVFFRHTAFVAVVTSGNACSKLLYSK